MKTLIPLLLLLLSSERGWPATASTELFLPASARASGMAGTNWRHDVRLYNPNPGNALVTWQYIPRSGYSADAAVAGPLNLPGGAVIAYANILESLFDIHHDTAGAIRIISTLPIVAESRIYNDAMAAQGLGTFGQRVSGIPKNQSIQAGGAADLLYIDNTTDFRTNAGLMDTSGGGSTAVIIAFDSSGATAGTPMTITLGAYEPRQLDGVLAQLGVAGAAQNYRISVSVNSGSVIPYASQVDNASGDPIFIDGSVCGSCGNAVLDGFARQTNNGDYAGYINFPMLWEVKGGAVVDLQDPTPNKPGNGDSYPAVYITPQTGSHPNMAALQFDYLAAPYNPANTPLPLPDGQAFDFSLDRYYTDSNGQDVLHATWHFAGTRSCNRIVGTLDALVLALAAGYEGYAGDWTWEYSAGLH